MVEEIVRVIDKDGQAHDYEGAKRWMIAPDQYLHICGDDVTYATWAPGTWKVVGYPIGKP